MRISITLLFILLSIIGQAQTSDTTYKSEVYYSSPKKYVLGGIEIVGVGDHYDKETLINLTGLKVGSEIKIPGDAITKAIKKVYKQKIFSDVSFAIDYIVGDKVYLIMNLREQQRLSKMNFSGLKKTEETKIKERLNPTPGMQVTSSIMSTIERIVSEQLKQKGFYNTTVNVLKRDDPQQENYVILDVIVERNDKIKISNVFITGNKEVKANVLKRSMKKTREKSLPNFFKSSKYIEDNYEEDKYNLIDKYNEKGFRDAEIITDSVVQISPKRVQIYLTVEEGNKYYFNNITWVGNTIYDSEYLSRVLNIKKGDVYNLKYFNDRLKNDEDGAVDKLYLNNGYLFFSAMPIETIIGKDSINLEIRIMEGPQATINRVSIDGNTRTHEHVIRRELYVYPGELFSREDVVRTIRELGNLGHFDPEQIQPDIKPDGENGTVDIGFKLVEKPNDRLELSGGWGAGMFMASAGLTFTNFSIRNVFNFDTYRPLPQGDGQMFSLKVQTNGRYYSTYSVSFTEPWLGGKKPNALSVSAYYSRQTGYTSNYYRSYYTGSTTKDMYNTSQYMTTFGASVGLGRRVKWPDDYFSLYTGASYQRYNLKNWPYYLFANGHSNNFSLIFNMKRSSIFNPLYTRRGSEVSLSLSVTPPYSMFDGVNYATEDDEQVIYEWIEYHKWKFGAKMFMPLDNNEKLILYTNVQFGYLGYYDRNKRSPFEGFEMGGDGMSGYSLYGREYVGLRGYQNGSLTNAGSYTYLMGKGLYGQVDASVYTKWTMEVRYPLTLSQSATVYALGFMEAGNSWYEMAQFEPFNLYRSAGVGVRIFLPMLGLLGIDWGYGFDEVLGANDASGSQFHFVLGQEF